MLKLQTEQDIRTGIKVLTCYLLPQSTSHAGTVSNIYFYCTVIA